MTPNFPAAHVQPTNCPKSPQFHVLQYIWSHDTKMEKYFTDARLLPVSQSFPLLRNCFLFPSRNVLTLKRQTDRHTQAAVCRKQRGPIVPNNERKGRNYVPYSHATFAQHADHHVSACELVSLSDVSVKRATYIIGCSRNFYAISRHYMSDHVTSQGQSDDCGNRSHCSGQDPRVGLVYPFTCLGSTCLSALCIHLTRIHVSVSLIPLPA